MVLRSSRSGQAHSPGLSVAVASRTTDAIPASRPAVCRSVRAPPLHARLRRGVAEFNGDLSPRAARPCGDGAPPARHQLRAPDYAWHRSCAPPVCCFASYAIDSVLAFLWCRTCAGRGWLAQAGASGSRRCTA